MNERPVWIRAALYNQFSPAETREIHKYAFIVDIHRSLTSDYSSKIILPLAGYMFSDGPWRDALIRFKYDPRKEVEARM